MHDFLSHGCQMYKYIYHDVCIVSHYMCIVYYDVSSECNYVDIVCHYVGLVYNDVREHEYFDLGWFKQVYPIRSRRGACLSG